MDRIKIQWGPSSDLLIAPADPDAFCADVAARAPQSLQARPGPNTFLHMSSSAVSPERVLLLADLDGNMGDPQANSRVRRNLEKCVAKVEKSQLKDGSWNIAGAWAPILGTLFTTPWRRRRGRARGRSDSGPPRVPLGNRPPLCQLSVEIIRSLVSQLPSRRGQGFSLGCLC